MKTIAVGILLAAAISGHSQLVLNTGEARTYQLNSLPFAGSISVFSTNLGGGFGFTIDSASFQSGEALRFEMFETSTAEAPFSSGTLTFAPPFTLFNFSPGAWQDVQGAVRLTVLSGSLTVDAIHLQAITPSPSLSSYNLFDTTFVPVPEPSAVSLLIGGIGTVLLRFAFNKRRSRQLDSFRL